MLTGHSSSRLPLEAKKRERLVFDRNTTSTTTERTSATRGQQALRALPLPK